MRRGWLTGLMLAVTIAATAGLLIIERRGQAAVPARIVTVQRGCIRNAAALSGRLAYEDETVVYAIVPGIVEEIYVQEGQRVAEGQALVRLKGEGMERVAAVWSGQASLHSAAMLEEIQRIVDATVLRAPENAVVREVMALRSAPVAAGVPVVRLSSYEQVILCAAPEVDARQIREGMYAEIMLDGEWLCDAEVSAVSDLTADPQTGRVSAMVSLHPEWEIDLPQGAAVDVDVVIDGRDEVPVLPVEALTERGTLWWVHEERCTEITPEIILSDEIHLWVQLPEGMQIAVGEFEEGQRVREVQR